MKDFEKELREAEAFRPKRPLGHDFEIKVQAGIDEETQRRQRPWWQRYINYFDGLSFVGRTGAAAATVAIFGLSTVGAYAAVSALWPKPNVTNTMSTQLPSGNRIVGYDAENCNYFGNLNGATPQPSSERVYYEVRAGSSVSDEQLRQSLIGVCEENISDNAIQAVTKQLPKEKQGNSTEAYTITAKTANSLTVSLDGRYDQSAFVTKPNRTYDRFDSGMIVYNQNEKVGYDSLQVGDTVKLILKDTSNRSANDTDDGYQPSNHPENQVVEAIVKIPALTADPTLFYRIVGTEIVRLESCQTSQTGFCRVYNFHEASSTKMP